MARNNNNLSSRSGRRSTAPGLDINKLLQATTLFGGVPSEGERPERPKASGDHRASSLTAEVIPHTIHFGSPASQKSTASKSGSEWTNLLKQTTSGGVSSALGGGLATIGGLASLVSGIVGLFGGGSGKPAPPPLVKFQLPNSQQQTAYVSSSASRVYQGGVTESPSKSAMPSSGIYGGATAHGSSSASQPLRYQSSEIAQAVKNALLNSSSLTDVIAEI